jgi:hypothetical protein
MRLLSKNEFYIICCIHYHISDMRANGMYDAEISRVEGKKDGLEEAI